MTSCSRVRTDTGWPVTDSSSCVTDPSVPSRIFCTGESLPTCSSISLRRCAISIFTTSMPEILRLLIRPDNHGKNSVYYFPGDLAGTLPVLPGAGRVRHLFADCIDGIGRKPALLPDDVTGPEHGDL